MARSIHSGSSTSDRGPTGCHFNDLGHWMAFFFLNKTPMKAYTLKIKYAVIFVEEVLSRETSVLLQWLPLQNAMENSLRIGAARVL